MAGHWGGKWVFSVQRLVRYSFIIMQIEPLLFAQRQIRGVLEDVLPGHDAARDIRGLLVEGRFVVGVFRVTGDVRLQDDFRVRISLAFA